MKHQIKQTVGTLILLGAVSGLFTACSSSPSPSSSSPSPSPSTATSPQPQASTQFAIPVGTFTNVRDDRAIQVEYSTVADTLPTRNSFAAPITSKGGKLIVVYMNLKNTGKESGDMFWTEFQLLDSQGRKYKEIADFEEKMSLAVWQKSQGLADAGNQLFPGATARTAKVFRVAPDADGLTMLVNDQMFDIGLGKEQIAQAPTQAQTQSETPAPQTQRARASEPPANPPTQAASSNFNAEIFDPPSNCRSGPSSSTPIAKVLDRGDVLVDLNNPQSDGNGKFWYQEKYLGCWIHQSQLRFK